MFIRQLLAIVVAALMAVPLWGLPAPPDVLGTIEDSHLATVRAANLVPGTTIYDGDVIAVGDKGGAWLSLRGGAGILLGANTQAQISKESAQVVDFDIGEGTVRFRSTKGMLVQGLLYDAAVRPLNSPLASGYIIMLSANSALIGATTGELLVTTAHDGASRTIPAGSAMEVRMVPDQQVGNTIPAKRRKGLIVLLGILLIAGVTIAAIILNGGQRQNVSPSSFPQ